METEALEDVVKIRIALVPVGEMSPEKYVEIFSQFVSLDFRNFSYGDGNKKKKLKYRDIRNDKIQFDFIRLEWAITNDWEDLFSHRRILGAIGIADCKQWDNILLAAEEFSRIIQEPKVMGNIIARLCLAVEPGEHQQDLDHETIKISNSKSTEKIVMVPNQDRVHTNHYFSTLFLEFSLKIIKEIEERIGSEVVMLQTPQDKNSVIVDSNKKIKNARFSKYQGDLCLLLGSPKDASEYYTACLEGIKTVPSESLWLASVYEGLACVKLIDVLERYAYNLVDVSVAETDAYAVERKNTIDQATVEITKYLEDAIDIYGKKRLYLLKLETMIKLTRFLLLKNNKIAASQTIMSAYAQSDSLTVQQKISLCSSMAIIYRDIGMIRKFSFFLRETAELCKSITLFRRSYGLLKLIAPYYHVQVAPDDAIEAPTYQNNNRNTYSGNNPLIISSQIAKTGSRPIPKKTRREYLLENGKDWIDIQSSIYDSLIEVAAMLQDPSYPVSYLITYLSNIGPFLPPEKQKSISDSLASYTRKLPPLSSPFCKGMLKLVCNSVQEKNKDGKLIELELDDARLLRSGPFLYKPKAKVQVNAMDTPVAHVSVRVPYVLRMQVENPLDLPITLKNLELRTDGLEIKSEVISEVVLPPLSKHKLDISVTSFEEGLMKEVELSYYAFNCQLAQAIKMELHVRFIQELSVLSVTSPKLNDSALSLFPGQYASFELLFKNLGDEVIDFLHFNVIESTTVKDDDPMAILFPQPKSLSWDQSIIARAAPLRPGQSFVLPIAMLVRETCSGVRFDVKYGHMATVKDWQRHLEIPLAFNVVGGLNITKFDIHECSTASLQRYHDLPPHRFFFTENTKEETHCLAMLEIKNVTTQPFYLEVNKDPASSMLWNDETDHFDADF